MLYPDGTTTSYYGVRTASSGTDASSRHLSVSSESGRVERITGNDHSSYAERREYTVDDERRERERYYGNSLSSDYGEDIHALRAENYNPASHSRNVFTDQGGLGGMDSGGSSRRLPLTDRYVYVRQPGSSLDLAERTPERG